MKLNPDDPRLTAYVLGELDESQRTEIEAAIQADESIREEVDRIRSFSNVLSDALGKGRAPSLSAERRGPIDAAIREQEQAPDPGCPWPAATPGPRGTVAALGPGTHLGNYVLVRRIGDGGMGTVYEAKQQGLDRRVAIKVLSDRLAQNPACLERFRHEARAAAALDHPALVEVYDIGVDQGHIFFSMQFVEGASLAERLRREGRIPVSEALAIVRDVAEALDHAWALRRLIHRDIKPENILLTRDGRVKLADLGLTKSVVADSGVTEPGIALGTPAYMAPEQGRGAKDIDCRADIYSLGITLFHAITGEQPFKGDTPLVVMMGHAEQPLPDPLRLNPETPPSVCDLLRRMCAKDPADRFQSPAHLLAALATLGCVGPGDVVGSPTQRLRALPTIPAMQGYAWPPSARSRRLIVLAVAGWAAAAVLLALLSTQWLKPRLDETVLRRLYDYAIYVAQKEPENYGANIRNLQEIEEYGEGTEFATLARTERERVEKARRQMEAFRQLGLDVASLTDAGKFADALALIAKRRSDPELPLLMKDVDALVRDVERRGEAQVRMLLSQAQQLAKAGEFDKARERCEAAKALGLSALDATIAAGVQEILAQENAAREAERQKAQAAYPKAFREIGELANQRDYIAAVALCTKLEQEPRFKVIQESIREDQKIVARAQTVYEAALAALESKEKGKPLKEPRVPAQEEKTVGPKVKDGGEPATPRTGTVGPKVKEGGETVTPDTGGEEPEMAPAEPPVPDKPKPVPGTGKQPTVRPAKPPAPKLADLPTERVIELARASQAKLGPDGLLNEAAFLLFEGGAARAGTVLGKAKAAGAQVTRYEYLLANVVPTDGNWKDRPAHASYEQDGWHLDGMKITGGFNHRAWGGTVMAQLSSRGQSISIQFDNAGYRFLTLWHSATEAGGGFQTFIHLSVNGQEILKDYRVPGHDHNQYEHGPIKAYSLPMPESWDISEFLRDGPNEVKITLSEKAPTVYWLKEVWLGQRKP